MKAFAIDRHKAELTAAMERMKSGRSRGKIAIQVARDASLAALGA